MGTGQTLVKHFLLAPLNNLMQTFFCICFMFFEFPLKQHLFILRYASMVSFLGNFGAKR